MCEAGLSQRARNHTPRLSILIKSFFPLSCERRCEYLNVSLIFFSYYNLNLYQNYSLLTAKLNVVDEAEIQEKGFYCTFSTKVLLKYSADSDLKL